VIDLRVKICSCAALLALLLAGCGNHDVAVPAECVAGPAAVRAALAKAPAEVRLDGRVRISDCFKHAAGAADVQNLGSIFIVATEQLADRVRAAPHSHAAVELGYLVGAVRRGAGTDMGVHYESERRVEQALVGVPVGTPEFRRGLAAGRRSG
jgi:hypothetical protein